MGFDWDDGNWPKCGAHGLSKAEIEEVFEANPIILPDRTPQAAEKRLNGIGRTVAGRWAFVAFTIRITVDDAKVRPISARFMHAKEIKRYVRDNP